MIPDWNAIGAELIERARADLALRETLARDGALLLTVASAWAMRAASSSRPTARSSTMISTACQPPLGRTAENGLYVVAYPRKRTVQKQSQVLDTLIRLRKPGSLPLSVLDCSCGIGTQAIGLALRGYRVEGTDLSPQAIQRARREALEAGVSARFAVADFRALDTQVPGTFDLVISCDNAPLHLLTGEDLRLGVRNMRSKLTPGGLLLVSIRDYDRLLQEKPPATMPAVYDGPEGKRVIFQVWEWEPDGPTYRVHFFILRVREGQWQTFHQTMVYRALPHDELTDALREEGFSDIRWHMPDETDYFQPIVTALRIG